MARKPKKIVCAKTIFCKNDDFSLQKHKSHQIDRFTFLAISLMIFELQRRAIPHFNPLNKSIWPLERKFFSKLTAVWVIRQNKVSDFFLVRLYIAISTITSVCPSVRPSSFVRHKKFFSLKSPWNHLGIIPRPPGLTPAGKVYRGQEGARFAGTF